MPTTGVVYVVDDDAILRASLGELVESVGLRVREFAAPRLFLHAPLLDAPACAVLDLRMPEMGGLELFDELRRHGVQIPVIVYTAHGDVSQAVRALRSGVFDFIEKPGTPQVLLERIQAAIEADAQRRAAQQTDSSRAQRLAALSAREREVLDLVVAGEATKAIARRLGISTKTVEYHRANIFTKLKVDNVVQLVRFVLGVASPELAQLPPEPGAEVAPSPGNA